MRVDPGSKTKRRKTMDKHGIVILADNPKKADEISAAFEKKRSIYNFGKNFRRRRGSGFNT